MRVCAWGSGVKIPWNSSKLNNFQAVILKGILRALVILLWAQVNLHGKTFHVRYKWLTSCVKNGDATQLVATTLWYDERRMAGSTAYTCKNYVTQKLVAFGVLMTSCLDQVIFIHALQNVYRCFNFWWVPEKVPENPTGSPVLGDTDSMTDLPKCIYLICKPIVPAHPKRRGGHFQTHSGGHFQTQSSLGSIFSDRDIILGLQKPRVIPNTRKESFSNTLGNPGGHFQTQASFLPAGIAFSRRYKSFIRHENYVIASQPCRLTTGGLGFTDGTGVWDLFWVGFRRNHFQTHWGHFQTQASFLPAGIAFSRRWKSFLWHENYVIASQPCRLTTAGTGV